MLKGDRPYRINRDEPRPLDEPPVKPEWLSPRASAEWDRVAPDLIRMGTAKAVDSTALAAYCEAVAMLIVLSDLIAKSGPLLIGRDGLAHKNPAVAQRAAASAEVRVWAREFGFTPAARQPLKVDVTHRTLPAERLLSG
ncbi:MAG TPA: phage terminase small subunit P27 family [Caldimonas sp.]|nr:phage terminase small subunit P27 family [Caldimonas sp.]